MAIVYHDKYTGDVGIGIGTPRERLEVNGGDIRITNDLQGTPVGTGIASLGFSEDESNANMNARINYNGDVGVGAVNYLALACGDGSGGAYTANTDGTLFITTTGRVGINKQVPTEMLHIASAGDVGIFIEADTDNSDENDNPLIKMSQDNGGTLYTLGMAGDAGTIFTGAVGNGAYVHSTNPAGSWGSFQIATAGDVAMTVDASQDIVMAGDLSCVALTETSDVRLKEEVADLDMGVDYINSLRPVSYKRKDDDSDKRHLGLIAQEVGPVTPDSSIVHYNETTDEYSLAYTQLIAPLIKSVQELSARVKELEGGQDE